MPHLKKPLITFPSPITFLENLEIHVRDNRSNKSFFSHTINKIKKSKIKNVPHRLKTNLTEGPHD